jgi:hypothetical protein
MPLGWPTLVSGWRRSPMNSWKTPFVSFATSMVALLELLRTLSKNPCALGAYICIPIPIQGLDEPIYFASIPEPPSHAQSDIHVPSNPRQLGLETDGYHPDPSTPTTRAITLVALDHLPYARSYTYDDVWFPSRFVRYR